MENRDKLWYRSRSLDKIENRFKGGPIQDFILDLLHNNLEEMRPYT